MIVINFEDTFEPVYIEPDLSKMQFYSPQIGEPEKLIMIKIERHPDPYLPNVFNLGFGPSDDKGGFDDRARLRYSNLKGVFDHIVSWI